MELEARVYCPFCGVHTSLKPAPANGSGVQATLPAAWKRYGGVVWWIGLCTHCERPVLVAGGGETVYPHPLPSPTDKRIPEPIRRDLVESKACFSAAAHKAAAVMARRALEAACIQKGATQRHLWQKVEHLANTGVITRDLKEWADVVRWVGNDGAHPGNAPATPATTGADDPDPIEADGVSKDDALAILQLAEQFLHVMYVTPAIAQEQRTKRGR